MQNGARRATCEHGPPPFHPAVEPGAGTAPGRVAGKAVDRVAPAAGVVAAERRLVYLGVCGVRRIRAEIHARGVSWRPARGAPPGPLAWIDRHAVEPGHHPLVL